MTNRRPHRPGRYTPPKYRQPPHQQEGPQLFDICWYGPNGEEIEITIDINDPNTDPLLTDLIRLMTDHCPHCSGIGERPAGDDR